MAISNAAFGKVIGGHLYLDLITRENFDVVHTHLTRDMGYNLMSVLQFDTEHGVAERFDDGSV